MATSTIERPQEVSFSQTQNVPGLGAYGPVANPQYDFTSALDKPPESKTARSLAFTDSDKRWLKDLGINTTDPNSYHKVWETEEEKNKSAHRKWGDTYSGRLGMRAVSRGIVGAAFYAMGNMVSSKCMTKYNPDVKAGNLLQLIAKCIDMTAGKAIKTVVSKVSGSEAAGIRAVTFRDTVENPGYNIGKGPGDRKIMGRSLGHEMMGVTFDFASMSFGDYMTRYVLGLMDPNAKSHWMKEGHLDIPGGVKDLLTNLVRGVTYAAGEDIAVALPYVYGMRLQRNIFNRCSPGVKYDFDRSLEGGSFKEKDGKIIGDYHLEGMLNLMGRFSWYNVGTKMFRDAYSNVQGNVENVQDRWKKGDHHLPTPHIHASDFTPSHLAKSAGDAARYVIRTVVKVMTYTLPATFVFALIRTPQGKSRGLAINQDGKGILGRDKISFEVDENPTQQGFSGGGIFKPVTPHSAQSSDIAGKDPKHMNLYYLNDKGLITPADKFPFKNSATDAYTGKLYEGKAPWYTHVTDPIGRSAYAMGERLANTMESGIKEFNRIGQPYLNTKIELSGRGKTNLGTASYLAVNASFAYPIYFMLKSDIGAAEIDNKRTDMPIDRTTTAVLKGNWGEFKQGVREFMRSLMREPFTDPVREERAQKLRWSADPERRSNEAYQITGDHPQRYVKNPDKQYFAQKELKAKKVTPSIFTQLKPLEGSWTPEELPRLTLKPKEQSWTAEEAARQFRDVSQPSQTIH